MTYLSKPLCKTIHINCPTSTFMTRGDQLLNGNSVKNLGFPATRCYRTDCSVNPEQCFRSTLPQNVFVLFPALLHIIKLLKVTHSSCERGTVCGLFRRFWKESQKLVPNAMCDLFSRPRNRTQVHLVVCHKLRYFKEIAPSINYTDTHLNPSSPSRTHATNKGFPFLSIVGCFFFPSP